LRSCKGSRSGRPAGLVPPQFIISISGCPAQAGGPRGPAKGSTPGLPLSPCRMHRTPCSRRLPWSRGYEFRSRLQPRHVVHGVRRFVPDDDETLGGARRAACGTASPSLCPGEIFSFLHLLQGKSTGSFVPLRLPGALLCDPGKTHAADSPASGMACNPSVPGEGGCLSRKGRLPGPAGRRSGRWPFSERWSLPASGAPAPSTEATFPLCDTSRT
jgi:hypothetical protein